MHLKSTKTKAPTYRGFQFGEVVGPAGLCTATNNNSLQLDYNNHKIVRVDSTVQPNGSNNLLHRERCSLKPLSQFFGILPEERRQIKANHGSSRRHHGRHLGGKQGGATHRGRPNSYSLPKYGDRPKSCPKMWRSQAAFKFYSNSNVCKSGRNRQMRLTSLWTPVAWNVRQWYSLYASF